MLDILCWIISILNWCFYILVTVHDYNFLLTKNMFSLQNQEIYQKNLSSVIVDKSKSQGRNRRRNMVIIRNTKVTTYTYPIISYINIYICIRGRIVSKSAGSQLLKTYWVKAYYVLVWLRVNEGKCHVQTHFIS